MPWTAKAQTRDCHHQHRTVAQLERATPAKARALGGPRSRERRESAPTNHDEPNWKPRGYRAASGVSGGTSTPKAEMAIIAGARPTGGANGGMWPGVGTTRRIARWAPSAGRRGHPQAPDEASD